MRTHLAILSIDICVHIVYNIIIGLRKTETKNKGERKMTIISSQHHIDWEIVEEKMEALKDAKSVVIPCWNIGEIDGE